MSEYHENPSIEDREKLADIGRLLGKACKPHGFVLLMFDFGDGGFMNYVSNAKRENMIVALKEILARFEGQPHIKGRA